MVQQRMSDVLGEFARTAVTEFSLIEVLEGLLPRVVDILPVDGACVTLLEAGGEPRCLVASDEHAWLSGAVQSELREGPGLRACETDAPVVMGADDGSRFPGFAARVAPLGVTAAMSFPLRQGDAVVGSLDLQQHVERVWDPLASVTAQTLADVTSAYLMIAQGRVDTEDAAARARRSSAHDDLSVLRLRTSEQRKAAILASVLDAVLTIDADGTVLECNPAAERMFGHPQREATRRNLSELLLPPDALRAGWVGLDRYLAGSGHHTSGRRVEVTGNRRDGGTFPAEVSITAVEGPGPSLFTAFVRDLTEQVAADAERSDLEARMRQSERLASLGQLAGGVAHDFNNLLTVIMNYAGFIAESEDNRQEARAQAGEIVTSAERAAELTKQLLLFARSEPVQRAPLDIGVVVRDVRELLDQAIGDSVELVVVEADDLPLVIGDRGQFEQVLMNLAVNARDAMPEGGTLTVETSAVEEGSGSTVELRVSDTGAGMSDHVLGHALDPFFTTKGTGRGSGLGLATVDGIVSDADGTIEVRSTLGAGTTFTIRLPARTDVPGPAVAGRVASPVTGSGERVLVVEDQEPVRKVIVAMLARNGYVVADAADSPTGLELASREPFDLLLADVVMPGMSGRELVTELRLRRPLQRVLYMSGYSGGAFGTERVLDPGEALIHKPFRESDLLKAVHAALRSGDGAVAVGCGGSLSTAHPG